MEEPRNLVSEGIKGALKEVFSPHPPLSRWLTLCFLLVARYIPTSSGLVGPAKVMAALAGPRGWLGTPRSITNVVLVGTLTILCQRQPPVTMAFSLL